VVERTLRGRGHDGGGYASLWRHGENDSAVAAPRRPSPPFAAGCMKRIAVYPGSFDPITKGHEDLIHRSLQFVDQLIVAVAVNVAKQPLFSLDERVALIKQAVPDKRLEVQSFEGLLAEFAKKVGASVISRGL